MRSERAPWGGSAQRPGGREQSWRTGAMRAESTLCSYAEESQTRDLESLGSSGLDWRALGCFPQLLPVKWDPACLLCTQHAPSLLQGTPEGNAPLAYRPGAERARGKAERPKGLSRSTWTQKPISRCFSAEVFPQHCQTQSRYSALLSAPANSTASSAQAERPPFSPAVRPAKPG